MGTYILISLLSGLLFGVLDALINANPIAVRLLAVFKPISRPAVNFIAGILIDLLYGFILAGLFILLKPALPGDCGLVQGLVFGLITWFLRVGMSVASQWVTYTLPPKTLLYLLLAGLAEMLLLGILYGLTL